MNPIVVLTLFAVVFLAWCLDRKRITKRARDLAAANAIIDQWAKMPNRDKHGRFSKKSK